MVKPIPQTTLFRRKKVEKFCSLAHVATNRIFDAYDASCGDKNAVCDLLQKLIDHVREFKNA